MQDNSSESYTKIMEYEQRIHEKNQNRIKIGIRLVIIIPLLFLFVMFKLDSSKVVFLVLWIVSLFGISIYLIGVEYMDYQLQIKLSEFGIREDKPVEGLLKEDSKVEKIIVNAGLLDDDRENKLKGITQKIKEDVKETDAIVQENTQETPKLSKNLQNEKRIMQLKVKRAEQKEKIEELEKEQIEELEVKQEEPKVETKLFETAKENPEEQSIEKYESEVVGVDEVLPSGDISDAEEELVQSIRKYVSALSKQSVQAGMIEDIQKKSPQDYAAMRRARALEKHDKEKE